MDPAISVIVCTHNPKREYLDKVLEALRSQSLPVEQWELLIIDNKSTHILATQLDISWHPAGYCIREEKIGLTYARLCGIRAANAELLIFVDDDNVLEKDYLKTALRIDKDWPMLGAWGGQTSPSFEEEPPAWTKPHWSRLGIREFDHDEWSKMMSWTAVPIGAGMCVRKVVAERYADVVHNDPVRLNLDRKGELLLCCGDFDLAWTSCDLGLGTGLFASLNLFHLMPKARLEEKYLLRIIEGSTYSQVMLHFLRSRRLTWKQKLQLWMPWLVTMHATLQASLASSRDRRLRQADARGRCSAINDYLKIGTLKQRNR